MTGDGLTELPDASATLLAERRPGLAGQRRDGRPRGHALGARRDPGARRRGVGGLAPSRRHRRRLGPSRAAARGARGRGARRCRPARSSSRARAGIEVTEPAGGSRDRGRARLVGARAAAARRAASSSARSGCSARCAASRPRRRRLKEASALGFRAVYLPGRQRRRGGGVSGPRAPCRFSRVADLLEALKPDGGRAGGTRIRIRLSISIGAFCPVRCSGMDSVSLR